MFLRSVRADLALSRSLASPQHCPIIGAFLGVPGVPCGCDGCPRQERGCAPSNRDRGLAAGSRRCEGMGDPAPLALGQPAEVRLLCLGPGLLWSPPGLGFSP